MGGSADRHGAAGAAAAAAARRLRSSPGSPDRRTRPADRPLSVARLARPRRCSRSRPGGLFRCAGRQRRLRSDLLRTGDRRRFARARRAVCDFALRLLRRLRRTGRQCRRRSGEVAVLDRPWGGGVRLRGFLLATAGAGGIRSPVRLAGVGRLPARAGPVLRGQHAGQFLRVSPGDGRRGAALGVGCSGPAAALACRGVGSGLPDADAHLLASLAGESRGGAGSARLVRPRPGAPAARAAGPSADFGRRRVGRAGSVAGVRLGVAGSPGRLRPVPAERHRRRLVGQSRGVASPGGVFVGAAVAPGLRRRL